MALPQKYGFDTEFDAGGAVAYIAPRPKRHYTPDEVEAVRRAALIEGERVAMESIAQAQAVALAIIADACRQALPRLAEVAQGHRAAAAGLALACGRAIADAALDHFPEAPVRAALEALAREIESQPRLTVGVAPGLAEGLTPMLEEAAQAAGFGGALTVREAAALGPGAFTLDFGDGQAAFDPAKAAERVTAALHSALAAEGLHAEPLISGAEA